jgi:hypothetical protein
MGDDAHASMVTCILCDRVHTRDQPGLVQLEPFPELCICGTCLERERDGWVTLDDVC